MEVVGAPTSAAGILSLMDDPDDEVKVLALEELEPLCDRFWAEISDKLPILESLYDEETFPARERSALLISKVYFHLGEMEEALQFALNAGPYFRLDESSQFVDTIVSKCIEKYVSARSDGKEEKKLEEVVNAMFERCFERGEYREALGIAIESRRKDMIKRSIESSPNVLELLSYCFQTSLSYEADISFRHEIHEMLVDLYMSQENPDYFSVTQCLQYLNQPTRLAEILLKLLMSTEKRDFLIACQISFDICDNAKLQFLEGLDHALQRSEEHEGIAEDFKSRLVKARKILSGAVTVELHRDFLSRKNRTDIYIVRNLKESVSSRVSMFHNAVVFANAVMHAGTGDAGILREQGNMEWFRRSSNWNKFSAIAAFGMIHRGSVEHAQSILGMYLPQQGGGSTVANSYGEAGALFALGLVHCDGGSHMIDYFMRMLNEAGQHESGIMQHGACLGLGLVGLASGQPAIVEACSPVLFRDDAVAGESAGICIGLSMLGMGDVNTIETLKTYARETQHEKIIRGIAAGLALVMYGREAQADTLIAELSADKDAVLRYGAMQVVALAYAGTSNNTAIRRALHVAVSDVSDDVRRMAVLALGFLLFKRPEQCISVVSLLSQSYNPHVRYGAALAVGIACSGNATRAALDLLEPLAKDPIPFVRQGALMGIAMVLMQANEVNQPRMVAARKMFAAIIKDRHESALAKVGAILATGIIDAGGRNVTIALHRNGHNKMRPIAGMMLFCQYWFWYPYLNFFGMVTTPSAIIGLNDELQMPEFSFVSNAPPSRFGYPAPIKAPEKIEKKRTSAVTLSTTARARARQQRRRRGAFVIGTLGQSASQDVEGMDLEGTEQTAKDDGKEEMEEEEEKETSGEGAEKELQKEEPKFEMLKNPARVTATQLGHISFDPDERYVPVKLHSSGIIMLDDRRVGEPITLVGGDDNAVGEASEEFPTPPPPASFQWP
eukprot:TRINITY_DN250_c1_g1_i1.p1 TRINITY_DN250_c1_g1~~TRINITY_DN250_c1_g1_i1.p1  ORF type:complete len:956 (+),score=249.77 TRINITY_DN250_c1_g1_i1:119-2986(+)